MAETPGIDPGQGIKGLGTLLQGATTGALGMITKVTIDGVDVGDIDVTTMNAAGGFKVFIAALKDPGTITMEMIYQQNNYGTMLANVGGTNESWTVTFPDGSTYVQLGHIKHVGAMSPVEDKITNSLSLRMSGPPTWHSHSGSP